MIKGPGKKNFVIAEVSVRINMLFSFSYEDLMFGEDEEEERPGTKAKKKVDEKFFLANNGFHCNRAFRNHFFSTLGKQMFNPQGGKQDTLFEFQGQALVTLGPISLFPRQTWKESQANDPEPRKPGSEKGLRRSRLIFSTQEWCRELWVSLMAQQKLSNLDMRKVNAFIIKLQLNYAPNWLKYI